MARPLTVTASATPLNSLLTDGQTQSVKFNGRTSDAPTAPSITDAMANAAARDRNIIMQSPLLYYCDASPSYTGLMTLLEL
jgi:hypothetical protein